MDPEVFENPPAEYRGGPLWVWNDEMDPARVEEQIDGIADAGWGSLFVHPRVGLQVEYLSAEWFEKVSDAVDRAAEVGVSPWLYDEDRWPSGYAGGRVPSRGPGYKVKGLVARAEPDPRDDVIDAVERDGEVWYLSVVHGDADRYMTARITGEGYADLMNPDAVEAFVQSTHERYADAVGDRFGDVVPGVFTDEPHLYIEPFGTPEDVAGYVPWTTGMPRLFRERYGYDLLDHLPALFWDDVEVYRGDSGAGGRDGDEGEPAGAGEQAVRGAAGPERDAASVRYDFWRLVTTRFVETYTERLASWCDEHDLTLTGHFMHEDSLQDQIAAVGAVMPHYRHQGQPGVDFLGRSLSGYGNTLVLEQCSSVARQFGRVAFSELYGGSGQQFSFETRKWLADFHLVHGITFLNPHLSLYSMRGERKRDFPPNIHYQQPWWPYNDRIEDYIARVATALREGEPDADTLLVHPVQSGWLDYLATDDSAVADRNDRFHGLVDALVEAHVDFDLGDELILAEDGGVADGALRVGEGTYDRVVVPYCRTLQSETVALLRVFQAAGGEVLVVGDPPGRVDGSRDETDPLDAVLDDAREVSPTAVVDAVPRCVRLVGPDGSEAAPSVHVHVRSVADGLVAFLANTSREERHDVTVRFDRPGAVERWDPVDGTRERASARVEDGETAVEVTVPETGSYLLRLRTDERPSDGAPSLTFSKDVEEIHTLGGEWTVDRSDPNALVIDECDVVLDGEDLGRTNVAAVWQSSTTPADPAGHVPFEAAYRFEVTEAVTGNDVSVVVESADEVTVTVNGAELEGEGERWRDVHWHRFDVADLIEAGENTVTVTGTRSVAVDVEPVYVLGEFAVREPHDERALVPEPDAVDPADVTGEGYPFFTGELSLKRTVDVEEGGRARLRFDVVHATLARVRVNDGEWHEVYWPPWTAPVELEPGENTVEVRLVTSLRNLTGPHHASEPEPEMVSPGTFRPPASDRDEVPRPDEKEWYDGYHVVPVGIESPALVR